MDIDSFIQKCDEMEIATEDTLWCDNAVINVKIASHSMGNLNVLMNIFAWIEYLGKIGHSASFKVSVDGDGAGRVRFEFDDKNIQATYDKIMADISQQNKNERKDIESFSLEG